MIHSLKKRFYLIVASYFSFWAKFVLKRWKPRVVIITGSSGKTSVLHLVEAQLGDKAEYTHHANSAFGISFQLLGLNTNIGPKLNWLKYAVISPFRIFRKLPSANLYIAEADSDRPKESKFIAEFLKPEATIWVSVFNTHSMNFDKLVKSDKFATHLDAIAYEFGYYIEYAKKLVLINGDQKAIDDQLNRVKPDATIEKAHLSDISEYKVIKAETLYKINGKDYQLPGINPKDLGIGIELVNKLLGYLEQDIDMSFKKLSMPPGRSSIFKGKNGLTLIDSTYNTGLGATKAMLEMFSKYPADSKWAVIGDILEQGKIEKDEHEQLAKLLHEYKLDKIILLGKRTKKFTYPLLEAKTKNVEVFDYPGEVLEYINKNANDHQAILFKGAFGMEGVVDALLLEPKDSDKLVRREPVWTKRRQQWGLPK